MDLNALYQEVILDHNRHPHNCNVMPDADCEADGFNPLCGDRLKLYLKVEDDIIQDASFQGAGCAISTASASMMTDFLKGKTQAQAEHMFRLFQNALTQDNTIDETQLGDLVALLGVKEFPARVKCATLAWHTLHAALTNAKTPATTE